MERGVALRRLLRELMGRGTQSAFAARTGIPQPTVAQYLSGVRFPGRKNLRRLIVAFPNRADEIQAAFVEGGGSQEADDTAS